MLETRIVNSDDDTDHRLDAEERAPHLHEPSPEEREAPASMGRAPTETVSTDQAAADFVTRTMGSSRPAGQSLIGSVIDGKYLVTEKLGEGGMGAVYKADHQLMDRTVALKVLHPHMMTNEESVRRFLHEARVASKLAHPHAVTLYDFGVEGSMPYIAMEFLNGRTLKEIIAAEGALKLDRAVNIVAQICAVLAEAHQLGIVHRDLKPDNIMVSIRNSREWVEVLDFGIAKVLTGVETADAVQTRTGMFFGTPQYMSPECISGKLDARSDLYSLGVILYEMLSGKVPFEAPSMMELIIEHLQKKPVPLRKFSPAAKVPKSVDRIVMKALEKSPDNRFASVNELMGALKDAVAKDRSPKHGEHPREEPADEARSSVAAPGETTPGKPGAARYFGLGAIALLVIVLGMLFFSEDPFDEDPRPAPGVGALRIESTPSGATLILLGAPRGATPLLIQGIPAGAQQIVLKKEGYLDYTRELTIEPEKELAITAELVKDAGADGSPASGQASAALDRQTLPRQGDAVVETVAAPPEQSDAGAVESADDTVSESPSEASPETFAEPSLDPSPEPSPSAAAEPPAVSQPAGRTAGMSKDATVLYREGERYRKRNEYERALPLLEEAVRLRPGYLLARLSLGVCYLRTGRVADAGAQFNAALALDRSYGPTHYNLAAYYARAGNGPEAIRTLKKAISLFPGSRSWARTDPDFDVLRSNSEFRALIGR